MRNPSRRGRLRNRLLTVRRLALRAAYHSGLLHAIGKIERRSNRGLTVLMYHSIGRSDLLGPALAVSEKNFIAHLEHLARRFHVVALESAVGKLQRGMAIPDNTIALTFDDGFRDNYETAFPLLKKYGIPAAIFVTTEPVTDSISLWPYRLRFHVKHAKTDRLELDFSDGQGALSFDTSTKRRRRHAVEAIETRLIHASPGERERLLRRIAGKLAHEAESALLNELPMLTWDQLREMAAAGIEIGSHTVSHPALAALTPEDATRELTQSKQIIESALARPVKFLAYPFGRPADFNPGVEKLARAAGYAAALTTVRGINRSGCDVFALKRLGVQDDPAAVFAFKLSHWLG